MHETDYLGSVPRCAWLILAAALNMAGLRLVKIAQALDERWFLPLSERSRKHSVR